MEHTRQRQLLYLAFLVMGLIAPWLGVYTVYLMTLYCFAIFVIKESDFLSKS